MAKFVEIIYSGEPITLQGFSDSNNIIFNTDPQKGNYFDILSLLSYEGNDTRIFLNYTAAEKDLYGNAVVDLVRSGTLFRIPIENIERETIAVQTNLVVPNDDYMAFLDSRIKSIISNPRYRPINRSESNSLLGKAYRVYTNFTVWIWCKALGDGIGTGKLIDVTPFIYSVSVTNGESGGNFQLAVAPALGRFVKDDKIIRYDKEYLGDVGVKDNISNGSWQLDKASAYEYQFRGVKNVVLRDSTMRANKQSLISNNALFHNIIQSNDVVFIKLEELEIENGNRIKQTKEVTLDNMQVGLDKLAGNYFDMIGLVDINTVNESSANAEISVNITGRDLMKLVLEDGEYFFAADFSGSTGIISDGKNQIGALNNPLSRLVDGNLNFFNAYTDRTIEFSLKFIMNMLSNIQICDDQLFKFYEERVKRYEYSSLVNDNPFVGLERVDVAGIWQIVRLVIDEKLGKRKIVDSSIVSDQGSLFSFITGKVCHKPFVEFFGDTYGDKYYFITRKPPFSQVSYNDNKKYAIDIDPSTVVGSNLTYDDGEVFSWYRLIPKGNFFGDDNSVALTYFPAIFLEEYAKIWGSRPMQQVSNYIDWDGIKDSKGTVSFDYLIKQCTQDLAFIIETNAYRPFTRKGTITLGMSDRRIKRGQCVRNKSTGEIFHVDMVSNSSIISEGGADSSCIVTVSRGMVEKYMEDKFMNYFNIVDLKKDARGESQGGGFKVNQDVFNFFLKRQQFNG